MKKENLRGLDKKEAEKILQEHGYNEIRDINKISPFKILLRQIKNNFIIYFLAVAVIISFLVEKYATGYAIIAVIVLVVSIGFVQEYKAERAISALKEMIVPVSIAIRDRKETEVLTRELVPGDILILRNGEKVPADCIILEETGLLVNESILTGESKEVRKFAVKKEQDYKEKNQLFTGSFIVNGKCTAKIINTGMLTKFGKIAGMISTAEKELLLQKKINKISKYMAAIGISLSVLTGILILLQSKIITSEVLVSILILTIAIAVSSFPEGFPVALITSLSIGTYRMAKKNAIVNRMSIIETLGETTVICSDKTGTITTGEMTTKEIYTGQRKYSVSGIGYKADGDFFLDNKKIKIDKEKNLQLLLKTAVLCNDAEISRTGEDNIHYVIGAPTEGALLIAGAKAKLFRGEIKHSREKEIPFSSERKIMTVLCKEGKNETIYSKGAFEILIEKCKHIQKENGVFKMLKKDREIFEDINRQMTSRSLRVIAFAYRNLKESHREKNLEEELIFIGIVGIEDPPRKEVKMAIEICRKAGIKVKMITGDNKETAIAIAKQINLDKGKIIDGKEIDSMTDEQLAKAVKEIVIYARVNPEHKLRIVKAFKENGEIITMTGDGVNDAPALKEAHIGIAMGKNGTDVSRSVADLTLKDDNFATIVDAIREGRTIFNNIRKFITYQISCNYAELMIIITGVALAPLFGWPIPLLLALQILFMNLVTDNLPAITLGLNPSSEDIMEEKPRKKSELLNKKLFKIIIFTGTIMSLLTLAVFYISFNRLGDNVEHARTTALTALIFLEIGGAFTFRSFRKGVFNRSPFINKYLFFASLISILATIIIIFTPLNRIFETAHITAVGWAVAISLSLFFVFVFDVLKKINNKKHFWRDE
ncbi:MAG: cation-transporting P-type ATPase [archaeon]